MGRLNFEWMTQCAKCAEIFEMFIAEIVAFQHVTVILVTANQPMGGRELSNVCQ